MLQTQNKNIFVGFKVNYLMYLVCIISTFCPIFSYFMAVYKHQEKPFPHATITATACHYPQSIVFRFGMLIASSILSLLFFVQFRLNYFIRWLLYLNKKVGYPTPLSSNLFFLTQISVFCYMIACGTIDQGGTGGLHGPCALTFFIVFFWSSLTVTATLKSYKQYEVFIINNKSIRIKYFLCFLLVLLWIDQVYLLLGEGKRNGDDVHVVIIQWLTTFILNCWFCSFCSDWQNIYLSMKGIEIRQK